MAAVTEQVWLDSLQGGFSTISCEICDLEITPTSDLVSHVTVNHRLPISRYFQKWVRPGLALSLKDTSDNPDEDLIGTINELISEKMGKDLSPDTCEENKIGHGNTSEDCGANIDQISCNANGLGVTANDWASSYSDRERTSLNMCKFCNNQFTSSDSFKVHLEMAHQLGEKECKKFVKYDSNVKKHECKICGKMVAHLSNSLKDHLMKGHRMTIEQYYESYIAADNGTNVPVEQKREKPLVIKIKKSSSQTVIKQEEDSNWVNNNESQGLDVMFKNPFFDHQNELMAEEIVETDLTLNSLKGEAEQPRFQAEKQASKFNRRQKLLQVLQTQNNRDKSNHQEKETSHGKGKAKQKMSDSVRDWANKCTFSCKACPQPVKFSTSVYRDFVVHLKSNHRLDVPQYMYRHGKTMTNRVLLTCKICQSEVTHTYKSIHCHTLKIHKMSPREYFEKYVAGQEALSDSCNPIDEDLKMIQEMIQMDDEEDNETFENEKLAQSIQIEQEVADNNEKLEVPDELEKESTEMEVGSVSSDESVICETSSTQIEEMMETPNDISIEESEKRTSLISGPEKQVKYFTTARVSNKALMGDWANKCTFTCQACPENKNFSSKIYDDMARHLRRHGLNARQHKQKYGKLMSKKVLLWCKICNSYLAHTYKTIHNHMTNYHKISPQTYQKKYLKDQPHDDTEDDSKGVENAQDHEGPNKYQNQTAPNIALTLWAEKCLYACQICNSYRSPFRERLVKHLIDQHNMIVAKYKKQFGSTASLKVFHKCLICSTEVTHSEYTISKHLISDHNIGIKQYYEGHVLKENITQATIPNQEWSKQTKLENAGEAFSKDLTSLEGTEKSKPGQNMKVTTKNIAEWAEKSRYDCRLCDQFKSEKRQQLFKHIYRNHNKMNVSQYKHKFGEIASAQSEHQCLICKEEGYIRQITHDLNCITRHLRYVHGTDIKQYYVDKIMKMPAQEFTHKKAHEELSAKAINNLNTSKQTKLENAREAFSKALTTSEVTEKSKPLQDNRQKIMLQEPPAHEIPNENISRAKKYQKYKVVSVSPDEPETTIKARDWADKCSFSCKECNNYSTHNFRIFVHHLWTVHKMNSKKYKGRHGDMMTTEANHKCLLCKFQPVHSKPAIQSHVERNHGISLVDYYLKHVLKDKAETTKASESDVVKEEKIIADQDIRKEEKKEKGSKKRGSNKSKENVKVKVNYYNLKNDGKIPPELKNQDEGNRGQKRTEGEGSVQPTPKKPKIKKEQKETVKPTNPNNLLSIKQEQTKPDQLMSIDLQVTQKPILTTLHKQSDAKDTNEQNNAAKLLAALLEQKSTIKSPAATKGIDKGRSYSDNKVLSCLKIETSDNLSGDETILAEQDDNLSSKTPSFQSSPMSHSTEVEAFNTNLPLKRGRKNNSADPGVEVLKESGGNLSWMDGCTFSCQICDDGPATFSTKGAFQNHVSRVHRMAPSKYSRLIGDPCTQKAYFSCRLCKEVILKDRLDISEHLTTNHKTSPELYRAMEIGLNH